MESSMWQANSVKNAGFSATSGAAFESLLLGLNSWTVYNDSASCSDSQSYTRELGSLTVFLLSRKNRMVQSG